MSFKNLGNKQTIVLHNCEIDNKKYDLVITPHTQTVGYIRTKRQTLKRKIITKQRQITRKRFFKKSKCIFRIRNQQFRRTLQTKRINR